MKSELFEAFINTKIDNNGQLEQLGNNLLKPLRVLLNGRSINLIDNTYILETSCNFKLFTTSNKIILIFSAFLLTFPGLLIKGLAWIMPSVKEKSVEYLRRQTEEPLLATRVFSTPPDPQKQGIFVQLPHEMVLEIIKRMDEESLSRFRRTSQKSYNFVELTLKHPRFESLPESIASLLSKKKKSSPLCFKFELEPKLNTFVPASPTFLKQINASDFGDNNFLWGNFNNGNFFIAFRYFKWITPQFCKENVIVLYQDLGKEWKGSFDLDLMIFDSKWDKDLVAVDYLTRLLKEEPCGSFDDGRDTIQFPLLEGPRTLPDGRSVISLWKPQELSDEHRAH